MDYWQAEKPEVWISGNMGGINDILILDLTTPESSYHVLVGVSYISKYEPDNETENHVKTLYRVPQKWAKRLFIRRTSNDFYMHLAPYDFCCRQILERNEVQIVECRSFTIPFEYAIDETYFHVGVGPYWHDTHDVYTDVSIHAGLKRLNAITTEPFGNAAKMIYALGTYDPKLR
ncbi:Hypothetical predicted protein [Paramuricea clavata]|uniref:Uncharacterized protein n=1 Tax=Paramuricea clavata TaxID=317549 RepID=A0A6S7GMZ5_PARCT|nr:Hypothetical predicted protein [Paramuricea clavata]